jgi:DNA-binding XRE family transcriptional regulator
MTAQIIKQGDQPEWAVIPYKEYLELLEKAEMLEDVAAYDRAIAINEEGIPYEVVKSLVEGENPLKVWRTYRGLTQMQLAEKTGLSQSQIAMIESGEREGTVKVLRRIAKALNVDIDDLVDMNEDEPSSG